MNFLKSQVAALVMLTFIAAFLISCSDGGSNNATETTKSESVSANSTSCVEAYAKKPCELLTEQLVRANLTEVPTEIKSHETKSGFYSCSYSWPSTRVRKMKVMGREMDITVDNQVSLSWIRTRDSEIAKNRFRRAYLPTEEEQKRARLMIEKKFAEKSNELGLDKNSAAIAKGLTKSVTKPSKYEAVDGLATMASWNAGNDPRLYVLDGNTEFQIGANVSGKDSENLETATAFAKVIMESCR